MMTNYGAQAILALPRKGRITGREAELRLLIAVESAERRKDDDESVRRISVRLAAATAGISERSARNARDRLIAAGVIGFIPAHGTGARSVWRFLVSLDRPGKPATVDDRLGGEPEPATVDDRLGGEPEAATSGAASPAGPNRQSGPSQPAIGAPESGNRRIGQTGHDQALASGNDDSGATGQIPRSSHSDLVVFDLSRAGARGAGSGRDGPAGGARAEEETTTTDQDQDSRDENPGLGQCADCGGRIGIVGRGVVARHNGRRLGLAGDCPGSGKRPIEPVRCIDCGRTGLALSHAGRCTTCSRKLWPKRGRFGTCPSCGRMMVQVTGGGRIFAHSPGPPWEAWRRSDPCPGEGELPAEEYTEAEYRARRAAEAEARKPDPS